MAARGGRGKEVAIQVEIESQEDWEETIGKEGLTVVDVYQEWCGPCKAMVSNFKRIKNEVGDDLLHFAIAKADSIESLERYRGKSEPCFLFYASGILVAVVRGANSPVLGRAIIDLLAHEHKVLEGAAERKEIRDPKLPQSDDKRGGRAGSAAVEEESESSDSEDEDDEDVGGDETGMLIRGERVNLGSPEVASSSKVQGKVMLEKMVTVAIIEPDVVAMNKLDDILEKLEAVGIEILEQTERQLTVDEVKEFFASRSEEDNFDDMCTYMASGPCQILVLTKGNFGEGIVEEWHEVIGPVSISEAKEQAPNSFRALYGSEENPVARAFHGSASNKDAKREVQFIFPDFVAPKVALAQFKPSHEQRTVAIIRPDVLVEHRESILEKIREADFKIVMETEVHLEREQAESFYKDLAAETYFEELVTRMSSGPLLALVLEKENAVEAWKALLGPSDVEVARIEAPDSLRAQFVVPDIAINQLHGSESEQVVTSEISFFFPMQHSVAVIKPDAYYTKEALMLKIREAGFNVVAQKEEVLTEEMAKNLYKNCADKEYFSELIEFMTSGPTTFLILYKNAAVAGWKELIGPTDPEVAKETHPQTLRAMFGTSITSNAVHGASDIESSKEELHMVFGDVSFDSEGKLKKKKKSKKVEEEPACVEDEKKVGSRPQTRASGEEQDGSRPQTRASGREQDGSRPHTRASGGEQDGRGNSENHRDEQETHLNTGNSEEGINKTEEMKDEDGRAELEEDDDAERGYQRDSESVHGRDKEEAHDVGEPRADEEIADVEKDNQMDDDKNGAHIQEVEPTDDVATQDAAAHEDNEEPAAETVEPAADEKAEEKAP